MSPGALRQRLAARITVACPYPQADSLLGAEGSPRTIGALCWELRLTTTTALPGRQRERSSDGLYLRRGIEVRVLAAGNPARRIDQWDVAEDAEARIRHGLLNYGAGDGLECVRNAIVFEGADAPQYLDGGAYRLTVLRFHVSYTESLE